MSMCREATNAKMCYSSATSDGYKRVWQSGQRSRKKIVPMELELSPAEEGSVRSNKTDKTLAAAVSDTMGMFVGVSNVVEASFRRRLL